MNLHPGTRVGPYEIIALIGVGGGGEVYRARDTRLNRIVAVKVLGSRPTQHVEQRERFEREARAIASLNHPHICALYDIGHERGMDFLVMEYLEGETLASRIERGPLSINRALGYAIDIAEALDSAHRSGLVHRDLKPRNIMITKSGAKLLDFGLVKLQSTRKGGPFEELPTPAAEDRQLTAEGLIVGTLPYMAPEQLEGKEADSRTDLFAFGTVVYEMVTGKRPFDAENKARVIAAILSEEPRPMSALQPLTPPALDRVVGSCLAKDPDERWQSAGDLIRELKWISEGVWREGLTTAPALSATRRWMAGGKPRWSLAAIGAALAGVLTGVALLLWPPKSPDLRNLVVLPCRAMGADPAEQVYCDGLAETLTARLGELVESPELQITPASEVRHKGIATVQQARNQLGATLALEGSWLRSGESVRVNYMLVDALSLRQLDAYTFTADAGDPFSIQDRVVEWAVRAMELKVSPGDRQALALRGTEVRDAYAFYLQGRGYLLNYQKPENIDNAILLFRRALERDPGYALAHAGLGEAYWQKFEATRQPQWVESARQSCEQALELDSNLAAGNICLGTLHGGMGRYEKAIEEFQRALESDPANDDAHLRLALAQEGQGDLEAAEKTYRRAIERRPYYWVGYSRLGDFYRKRARFNEAAAAYEQAIALTPDNASAYAILGGLYAYLGRYEEAVEILRKSMDIDPTFAGYANLGMTYFRLRRFGEAAKMLEKACELRPGYQSFGNLARTYYWSGRKDRARALYERAIRLGEEELKINPNDVNVRLSLADYYAKLGLREKALEHVQKADPRDDPHLLFFVALIQNQLGVPGAALASLEKAVARRLPPAELQAWIELDNLRHKPEFLELFRVQ